MGKAHTFNEYSSDIPSSEPDIIVVSLNVQSTERRRSVRSSAASLSLEEPRMRVWEEAGWVRMLFKKERLFHRKLGWPLVPPCLEPDMACPLQLRCKDSFYVPIVRRISVVQGIRQRHVMRRSTCFFFHFVQVGSCALVTSTCHETIWVEERLHMSFTLDLNGVK